MFPPGPPGLPIVGNVLDFDPLYAWTTFTKWKKTYGRWSQFNERGHVANYDLGDLVYINVAGQDIVILNSHKVAADLLDRRGPIYSNRPRWIGEIPRFSVRNTSSK